MNNFNIFDITGKKYLSLVEVEVLDMVWQKDF